MQRLTAGSRILQKMQSLLTGLAKDEGNSDASTIVAEDVCCDGVFSMTVDTDPPPATFSDV